MLIPIVLVTLCFMSTVFVCLKRRRPPISAAEENISLSESSQSTSIGCDYEVYLSFCRKDTGTSFSDFLYESLVKAGINTYRDDEQLCKGEKVAKVYAAIEHSRISIPVMSKNYAASEWCLHELKKIVECSKLRNQKVLPIFYDVEPSVVSEQSGFYKLALSDHKKRFDKVTIENWRLALKEVASFTGWEVQSTYGGYQGKLINEVISYIWSELGKAKLVVPVGIKRMDTHVKEVIKLLDPNANDVRIVVIYGNPSSGKTILAKSIYNNICDQFEKSCFLQSINEKAQRHGLEFVQEQLIYKILGGKGPKRIHNIDEGINIISQRFHCRKILVLLDDVDQKEQLDALAKESKWFGLGSRIIVTTRNRDILKLAQVYDSFEITVPQINAMQLLLKPIIGSKIQDATVETLDCLRNGEVQAIGIWGVGGVGKTTLAYNVNDSIAECRSRFDGVYWVTVSQNCSIYSLQEKIARRVGIDLSKEDDGILRSTILLKEFQCIGRCLLILDDVWNYIPLEKVGISHSVKECKLIITSRSYDICQRMGCGKFIKVDALDEESAWSLFQENLKPDGIFTHGIIEVAKEVLKECAGLPLAIITMGSSMRGVDDIEVWRDTLKKIKESKEGHEGFDAEVFPLLKHSYDCLKDRQVQQCFLHCAVYPEDFTVRRQSVIELFIDLGLIKEDNRKAEYDRGRAILNKLQNVSLLERSTKQEEGNMVMMHDLIRDMALRIKKFEFMVKAGISLKEVPDEEKWTTDFKEGKDDNSLELVSLMSNRINDISISPNCPKLSALLLNNNSLQRISNCFFFQFPALKVLDLSETRIEELPNSVANLGELKALILSLCYNLKVLPSIAKLTKLRKLDLCKTSIKRVPNGLNMVANLQYLDLFETNIKEVPAGIIPKLCHLRFLKVTGPSGEELAGLRKLERLWVWFSEWDDYCTFVTSSLSKPHIYYIGVGCQRHILVNFDRYVTMDGVDLKEDDYFVLPEDAQCLVVTNMHNLSSLWDIRPESFETFSYLKQLMIHSCDGMKNVLDSSFVANLLDLEVLTIQDCEQVEEIIVAEDPEQKEEDSNASIIAFPKLRIMELRRLTNLKRITAMPLVCDNLNQVDIYMCPILLSLKSLRLSNPQRLEKLHLVDCEQLEEMISTGQEEESSMSIIELPKVQEFLLSELPNLKSLSVRPLLCVTLKVVDIFGCQVLVSLMLLGNLPSLEQLFVRECKQLEEIFAAAGQDVGRDIDIDDSLIALPKLQYLHLRYLPNLKSISTRLLACDSIKQLCITECPKLKKIPFSLQSVNGQLSPPSSLKQIQLQTLYKNYGELKEDNKVEEEFEKAKRWWGSLEWDDPNAELILRPFTQMQGEDEVSRKLSNEIATAAMQSI